MQMINCTVMLGANMENSFEVIKKTISEIASLEGVYNLKTSRLFLTTAVSPIPQNSFLNIAVCFSTTLSPYVLFAKLEEIEKKMGKKPKAKEEPRIIDIDLIFYGDIVLDDEKLTLPHPRWKERLFVLYPLSDLMDVQKELNDFKNSHNEKVVPYETCEGERFCNW